MSQVLNKSEWSYKSSKKIIITIPKENSQQLYIMPFDWIKGEKKVAGKSCLEERNGFPREFFLLQFCPRWKFISFSLDIPGEVGNTNEERWVYKTRGVMLLPLDNEQSPEVTATWRSCLEFKRTISPNDESLI